MVINEKYSYKDLSEVNLSNLPSSEFNGTTIIGSCFFKEGQINRHIFPDTMEDVKFVKCNLDNCYIPDGNYLDDNSTNKQILTQNDLEDWVVDDSGQPLYPLQYQKFIELGLSTDPKDIPLENLEMSITWQKQQELNQE